MRPSSEVFEAIAKTWGTLDFVVHAIAFSDRNELKGSYADTTRENFVRTMVISCFSFTEIGKPRRRADAGRRLPADPYLWRLDAGDAELQRHGGGESGTRGFRALSRRRFRAARDQRQRDLGRADAHACRRRHRRCPRDVQFPEAPRPLRRTLTLDEVGGAALYLLSDLSGGVTGEIHYVDCGYSTIAMPNIGALKLIEQIDEGEPASDKAPPREAAQ